ncbi:hypothetical protein BC940DRAFT_133023 [Gongronella butleri]|nr:hypothetical protein BC940DRAFT_133023 [Gongronella butleri]
MKGCSFFSLFFYYSVFFFPFDLLVESPYLSDTSQDDEGLMVQCDACEVWQHCKCVGLQEETDIPDQYYCELCRPSNHKLVKSPGKRTKRYYSSEGFPPDTDDLHASKKRKKRKTDAAPKRPRANGKSAMEDEPMAQEGVLLASPKLATAGMDDSAAETRTTRPKRAPASSSSSDDASMAPPPQTAAAAPRKPRATKRNGAKKPQKARSGGAAAGAGANSNSAAAAANVVVTTQQVQPQQQQDHPHSHPWARDAAPSRASTPHSLDDTLQHASAPHDYGYWDKNGIPSQNDAAAAKIKYPHAKMSIADMHRRARMLMDHVEKLKKTYTPPNAAQNATNANGNVVSSNDTTSTATCIPELSSAAPPTYQSPLSTISPPPQAHDQAHQERPRSLSTSSTSSSASSASTLPLLTEDGLTSSSSSSFATCTSSPSPIMDDKPYPHANNHPFHTTAAANIQNPPAPREPTCTELMDGLLNKLIQFQKHFDHQAAHEQRAA